MRGMLTKMSREMHARPTNKISSHMMQSNTTHNSDWKTKYFKRTFVPLINPRVDACCARLSRMLCHSDTNESKFVFLKKRGCVGGWGGVGWGGEEGEGRGGRICKTDENVTQNEEQKQKQEQK